MKDQAERLRLLVKNMNKTNQNYFDTRVVKTTRVIAVTSGKGGVGKTNFTVNLGLALTRLGKKVVVLDADLGLANIDVVLGLMPKNNLNHVIRGQKKLNEIMIKGPEGLNIIAGGSGIEELVNLEDWQVNRFIERLVELEDNADLLLVDTGAGLTKNVLSFVLSADEVVIITTPEPTSLTDAYALIKVIAFKNKRATINLVVNRALSKQEGEQTAKKLMAVSKHFLDIRLNNLGVIRDDHNVSKAVKMQEPFLLVYPQTIASKGLFQIAVNLTNGEKRINTSSGVQGFFGRIARFLR